MKYFILFLTAAPAIAHTEHFDQPGRTIQFGIPQEISTTAEAGWFNRYLAEGRETFDNSGVFTTLTSISYNSFAIELWGGFADSSADREFDAHLHYSIPDAPLGMNLGLGYITDGRGGPEDWDVSLAIGETLFQEIEWHATLTYGLGNGGYLETGISRNFDLGGFQTTFGSHIGSNFNYVTIGHNGPDHYAIQCEISRKIIDGLSIKTALAYYTPIAKNTVKHPDDADLYRGLHFGISAEYAF